MGKTGQKNQPDGAAFFTQNVSETYDERNSRLAPIAGNMHFLIRLALGGLPERARVLCVGVGTGAEILALATAYPQWSFVGVDPSAPMLDRCRQSMEKAGFADRCLLVYGYVQDIEEDGFDAVLSVLVGHFIARADRADFYGAMHERLKPGGYFINTEISFDLDDAAFATMLAHWGRVQTLMGATPESLASLPVMLRDVLCVLPPAEVESMMQTGGIALPVRFFQSFMIMGWYGKKDG